MTQEIVCLWLSASIKVYSLRKIMLFVEHSTMSEKQGGNKNFKSVDFSIIIQRCAIYSLGSMFKIEKTTSENDTNHEQILTY